MDAGKINELNADQSELQQRRSLALARQQRESERKALLGTLGISVTVHLIDRIHAQQAGTKAKRCVKN